MTVTGYTLEGVDAANYKLTQPTGVTVTIAKRNLTISGLTANGKTYNNSTTATASGIAKLENVVPGESIVLGAAPDTSLEVLLLGGEPLREPVAAQGPFVMNTRDELVQAFADFQSGKLGTIPAGALRPFRG